MKNIIDILKNKKGFESFGNATNEQIKKIEEKLDLKFAKDYKIYLSEFGAAEIEGHEFTGIINSKRLNVLDVTQKIKKNNENIKENMYVIEELNIDNIAILQDVTGKIYEVNLCSEPKKINNSFIEYIELL